MKNQFRSATLAMAAALLIAPAGLMASTNSQATRAQASLENEIRHEIVMLPWYNIFDSMRFSVDSGGVVTLTGQVTRPTLKSSAENVVKRIEGVSSVRNEIEVLPLSPNDDRIRLSVARAIYGYGPMQRYALGAQPPIRIIVKNGNVTLEGMVASEFDKNIANIRANGVSGVFAVTNNLTIGNARG